MTPSSKEVLTSWPNDKITISSVEDFKKKLKISNLPEWEIKIFFEQPLETTQSELDALRKKYLSWEPDLTSVKEFLQNAKNSILEETKEWVNQVKEVAQNIQESMKIEEAWDADLETSWKEAENELNSSLQKLDKVSLQWKAKEALKDWTKKAWELVEKAKKTWYTAQLWEALHDAFSKLKNFDIFWALISFFKWLFWMFIWKEVLKKAWDKAKEKLSSKEIEKTKDDVKQYIVNTFWDTLTEENKNKLEQSINKLSKEQLRQLNDKLKSGKLTYYDIVQIIPNIYKEILKPEQIEKIKIDAQKRIVQSITKEISSKYSIKLEWDKLKKLEQLVKENTTLSDESIWKFIEINNNQEIRINDLFWPLFEAIINSTALLTWLLTKNIIPISAFWLEFADASGEIIKLSASALWISDKISIDTFNKSVENMSETEKALIVWLLYRKWWLLLNIIWSISETVSRVWIEFATKTSVKTHDLVWASIKNDYPKQIKNLDKISKSLWVHNDVTWALDEAIKNLNKVKENYKILHILSKSEWDTSKAIELLKKAWIDNLPNKDIPFDRFVSSFKDRNLISNTLWARWSVYSMLWFWANADLFRLNEKLKAITSSQTKMFEGNFLSKGIWKLRELSNIWEISRAWDRLVLHFESIDAAKKWISKWNILANKFPDLVKWTLDKLPIIAVAWIAYNSEKPFFEELKKEMKYLLPIVWPIMLVSDSWFSWKNWKIESINAVEAWIGWALLTLDSVFLTKEFIKWGSRAAWTYMLKPITDIYSIIRWAWEWTYSIWKAIVNWKSFWSLLSKSIENTKSIKRPKLRVIAILLWVWYLWMETVFADNKLESIFGEDWKMDKQQLKKEVENLWDKEKELCIKYLISETFWKDILNNIKINISNNKLNIISHNPKVQWDWLIDNDMLNILNLDAEYTFKYIKNPA